MINFLYIISCIYFFIPAYIANAIPPLANTFGILDSLNKPVDNNKKIKGVPVLGTHKTWRGVVLEIFFCTTLFQLSIFINSYFQLPFFETLGINFNLINPLLISFLLSIGIVFGDVFFAFIKRRLQLRPGAAFIPFDQTNYVIGAFLFIQPILGLSFYFWSILFILTFFIHVLFNRIGYNLGLHKAKW